MMSDDGSSDLEDEPLSTKILKTGWLVKQGGGHKSWKKRWFVLTNNYLKYYKSEKTSEEPQGMIYLRAVNKVERTDDGKSAGSAKNPLEAFAVSTPERVYVICGNSEQEAVSWVDTIRAALPNNGVGLQAAEVVKAGYLTKQGGSIKTWKKRWFVLRKDNLLAYYKDETPDLLPLGKIDLDKVTEVRLAQDKLSKEFGFEIVTKSRVYGMYASTKQEMEEWMHLLLEIVGDLVDADQPLRKARAPTMVEALDDEEQTLTIEEINDYIRSDTKIVKQGYLTKQGGSIKSWKRRWFVLREATLAYYHDEKEATPLGLIPLNKCQSFQLASKKLSKPNAIEVTTSERTYFFSASNEEEMWEWIHVLQEAMTKSSQSAATSVELRAMEKAAQLAVQKKAMQMKVLRKAGVNKLAKLQKVVRRASVASRTGPKSGFAGDASASAPNADWAAPIAANEQKLVQEKVNLEDQLLELQSRNQTDELGEQIKSMQSEIERLASQLSSPTSPVLGGGGFEAQMSAATLEDDDETPIAWARAIADYNPNAYDSSAIPFKLGDLVLITKNPGSGQCVGIVNGRKGVFPFRYVEELNAEETKQAKQAFQAQTAGSGSADWNDKLDDTTKSLFDMYDSDGDGFMSKLDFFEFLYEFGKTYLSDKQVERCWQEVDSAKRGKVDSLEFSKGVKRLDEVEFFADWTG